ncbi:multidrug resistance-associated protein 1-like [Haliotis cracherodii]|uniref:multidrug resistance-associated protein 1-like n=1 Tax=Haliotis cracherodii TaxID=6455 RepID=UPI0039EC6AD2
MTDTHLEPTPCPEINASKLSRLFFLWSNGLLKKAYKEPLTEDTLWAINPREKCQNVCPKFERILSGGKPRSRSARHSSRAEDIPSSLQSTTGSSSDIRYRKGTKEQTVGHPHVKTQDITQPSQKVKHRSLWMVIIKTFWKEFFKAMGLRFLQYIIIWTTNPFFMSYLIDTTDDPNSSVWMGMLLSMVLLLLLMTAGLLFEHSFFNNHSLEMHIRSSLMSSVFKKAMNLHWKSRKKYSVGEMTNYLSSDADTIAFRLTHLTEVMYTPLHFFVVFSQLFRILGPAAWFGLVIVVLIMPINVYIAFRMRDLFDENSDNKDEKMKLLNEVLTGIKVLKLHAWEKCFGDKLDAIRTKELSVLRRLYVVRAFNVFSWNASTYVISVVMFCGFYYLNGDSILSPRAAFAVVSLLNLLRFAISQTPEVVFDITKASISVRRLQTFLREDEFEASSEGNDHTDGIAIKMENANFSWDDDSSKPALKAVNLRISEGSLVAVVGHVGAGKSSLVAAVLGEIQKVKGHLSVKGRVAYVPQQAWIQNDTLQNNILFGKPMDRHLYDEVVECCALKPDLDLLPAGDLTEIGERGINLSGGQKQRVSLARAVYNDADIYLLDDPLSAVDSHVGKHIFDFVIGADGMLKEKTRVLVTHNVRYLPGVDNIVVVGDGTVAETGSFRDLLNSDGVFTRVLRSYLVEYEDNRACVEDLETGEEEDVGSDLKTKLIRLNSEDVPATTDDKHTIAEVAHIKTSRQSSRHLSTSEDDSQSGGKCIEEEEPVEVGGKRTWNLFLDYARAYGYWQMLLTVTSYCLYYILWLEGNIWLAQWTEDPLLKSVRDGVLTNGTTQEDIRKTNMQYLSVYSGLGLAMSFCILIYTSVTTVGVVKASRELHHKLLTSILRAPMKFFDTTPIGRITNRFSHDIDKIDGDLQFGLEFWLDCVAVVVVSLVAVVYSSPHVTVLIIPLAYYYHYIQKYHSKSTSQLRNLESKTRSPIESHFTESVTGAEVVRAYGAQERFVLKLEKRIDNFNRVSFYQLLSHRWMGIHLLVVGNVICSATSLLRNLTKRIRSGALVGLGTAFSLDINSALGFMVITQSEMEVNLMSMDRVQQFINSPNEAALRKGQLPFNWPDRGRLEFINYSLRYRQGRDLVLKNITFTVHGGEKIGVVGRTGAGKSSLMLSLFRLVEPTEGAIVIDGVDIADIGLHDLREKLAIIPQDPFLFTGPLRMNLDPEDLYTDEDIWAALDHTHLRSFVECLSDGLETDCGEGGSNFSVGQCQLFCMTRTLLRKAKILVLDEATASVDMETDDLIQQTIRSEFKDCTVLTIAHRLNTVIDYDRILVLDEGEVKEFDSPEKLLQTKGVFYQMARDAGVNSS